MPIVKLPNGQTAKFPDDMPLDKIQAEIEKAFPSTPQSLGEKYSAGKFEVPKVPAREALEYGGLAVGGAVGGVPGAAIGYGAGRQAANLIEESQGKRKPVELAPRLAEAGKDLVTGAAMEAGGQGAAKIIEAGAGQVAKLAPRIYEAVLKVPPRSVPNDVRNRAVQTALEGQYPPTQKGLNRLQADIDGLNREIDSVVTRAGNSGKEVDMNAVVKRVDKLKDFYNALPPDRAKPFIEDLEKLQSEYLSGGAKLNVVSAQEMKKRIYQLHRKHYGELKTAVVEGEKAIARGLKEELVKQIPEIGKLNAKDSARIELENVLERAVNRTRNWDLIGLVDVGGSAVGGAVGARQGDLTRGGEGAALGLLFTRALRDPAVASRLAFALSKANRISGKSVSRPVAFGTGKLVTEQNENQ